MQTGISPLMFDFYLLIPHLSVLLFCFPIFKKKIKKKKGISENLFHKSFYFFLIDFSMHSTSLCVIYVAGFIDHNKPVGNR
jgi:hypothetical protein